MGGFLRRIGPLPVPLPDPLSEVIVLDDSIHLHLGISEHRGGFTGVHVLFGQIVLGPFLGFRDGFALLIHIAPVVFQSFLTYCREDYNLFFHTQMIPYSLTGVKYIIPKTKTQKLVVY